MWGCPFSQKILKLDTLKLYFTCVLGKQDSDLLDYHMEMDQIQPNQNMLASSKKHFTSNEWTEMVLNS